ncbi:MAG: beta family protein [Vicinamibacteria bacterium]
MPILTGKKGEFRALAGLNQDTLYWLRPLIDMPPITLPKPPKAGEKPRGPDPPEKTLGTLMRLLEDCWGRERRVIIDLAAYDPYPIGGRHPAEWLFANAHDAELLLTASLATDSSDFYRAAVAASEQYLKGLCLRIRVTPKQEPEQTVEAVRELARAAPSTDPAHKIILLDLRRVSEIAELNDEVVAFAKRHIDALARADYRVDAVAGTSVPLNSWVKVGQLHRERRREWRVWEALDAEGGRELAFADYGITGPRPDSDEWRGSPAPFLRYTTAAALLVWKGRKPSDDADPDDLQKRPILFPELCRKLVDGRKQDFRGPKWSAGDRGIWDAAHGTQKPGIAMKWIEFATNHHLTEVVRLLNP